jgi:hypothetical protein
MSGLACVIHKVSGPSEVFVSHQGLDAALAAGQIETGPNGLPHIVMQTWRNHELPIESWAQGRTSVQAMCPNWAYVYLTDTAMYSFVHAKWPSLFQDFTRLPYGVQKADVLRYLWLETYGGLYLDMDYLVKRPLGPYLDAIHVDLMVLESANASCYTNSFLVARPGLGFFRDLAEKALSKALGAWWAFNKHTQVMSSTGPLAFHGAVVGSEVAYAVLPRALFLPWSPVLHETEESLVVNDTSRPDKNVLRQRPFTVALDGGTWNSHDTVAINFLNRHKWTLVALVGLIIVIRIIQSYLAEWTIEALLRAMRRAILRRQVSRAGLETLLPVMSEASTLVTEA